MGGHAERMEMKDVKKFYSVNVKGRNHFEHLGLCGGIVLKWILKIGVMFLAVFVYLSM
jgi:hypothetical protein